LFLPKDILSKATDQEHVAQVNRIPRIRGI